MRAHELLRWLESLDPLLGYAVLALASLVEYLFPPFPGDTVTVLGAIMVGAADWSLTAVLATTTAASVVGAWINFEVGRFVASSTRDTFLHRLLRSDKWRPRVEALNARFAAHGSAIILANRFLPAVRGVFFVVAAMAGLSRRSVLFGAAVSALVWNALLITVGYLVGFNLDRLMSIAHTYASLIYGLMALALVVWAWRHIKRRGDP